MLSSSSDRCSCESREAVRTLPRTMHRSTRHTQRHPCEILIVSSARERERCVDRAANKQQATRRTKARTANLAVSRNSESGLVA